MRVLIILLIFILGFILVLVYSLNINGMTASIVNDFYRDKVFLEKGNSAVINIWIDSEERLDRLKENEMKYLFVDIGDTGLNGRLLTSDSEILSFLDFVSDYEEKNDFDFVLIPYSEINTQRYDFTLSEFQENFISDYKKLVNLGFDGVYVDIEPVSIDERYEYLRFLERLNNEFSDEILVVYSGHFNYKRSDSDWIWDNDFFVDVGNRVDLIFLGLYDSGSESDEDYREYIKDQLEVANLEKVNFIFGVPTHKEYERIEVALEIFEEEIFGDNVLGISVFAEWTTDDWEWKVIKNSF